MTLERHPFIVYLAGLRERENLEAARIGEHRIRPAHEPMQTTQPSNHIVAGAQVEVIGIGEHERSAQFPDLDRGERLDRCLRANGSKNRRNEITMRCGENPCAGAVVFGCDDEFKHEGDYNGIDWRLENRDSVIGNGFMLVKTNRAQSSPNS